MWSREVSIPRDWHRQQCCGGDCQTSERSDNSKYQSRDFENSRDLTIRHLIEYRNWAQVSRSPCVTKRYFQLYMDRRREWTLCTLQASLSWWRHQMEQFPRYWPFVWGIHRSPVNCLHKASDAELWFFSLVWAWINGWVNIRQVGDWVNIVLIMTSL